MQTCSFDSPCVQQLTWLTCLTQSKPRLTRRGHATSELHDLNTKAVNVLCIQQRGMHRESFRITGSVWVLRKMGLPRPTHSQIQNKLFGRQSRIGEFRPVAYSDEPEPEPLFTFIIPC